MTNLTAFYEDDGVYVIDSGEYPVLLIATNPKTVFVKNILVFSQPDVKGFVIKEEKLFLHWTGRGRLEEILIGEVNDVLNEANQWVETVNRFYSK